MLSLSSRYIGAIALCFILFTATHAEAKDERLVIYLANCKFEDRLSKFEVQASMYSDAEFEKEAFFLVDGEKILIDFEQKSPSSGERFRIIAGEHDTYFSVEVQIYGGPPKHQAMAIATVRNEGEITHLPGTCEFVD